jgi:predicted nucleic acid-binding protein
MIILDTNVLSALMMPERNEEVLNWADLQPA